MNKANGILVVAVIAATVGVMTAVAPGELRWIVLGAGLLVFGVTIGLATIQHRRWLGLANELGLDPGPLAGGILHVFVTPDLRGVAGGRPARVHTFTRGSGKSSKRYTAIEVQAPRLDPAFRLRLTAEGLGSALAKAFGGQDVHLDDAAFDKAFRIEASDPLAAPRALDTLTREMLLGHRKGEWRVEARTIVYEERGLLSDARRARELLELAARLAASCEAAARAREA